ncbi:sugar phosphate isomerase/epimerase [Haloferax sp. Atlit-4N]|uniref:sugar phosphate isomerase/epimerase family protein n=1 Tax=Haloferax sp. Atlit-4N TaxID=2077206 RepID=UPI000E28010E|nr:sugar phosphate isomerase/epimerase [Haloferax sp. Atlit-4N]RDZ51356.1 sugar phosphate isomerase/epimerase [Haloferax sp. Atlit-4N]
MAQTAINLYSVRELDEPMLDILDRIDDAGYDGVQISGGFRDAMPEEATERIRDKGLSVAPAHISIEQLEDDLEATLADYRETLGAPGAVVPYLGEEHFESTAAVDETAARLTELADAMGEHGWDLHYHNHAHEFVDLGDEDAFERFIRKSGDDVLIELDVGWALVGGADPTELIEEHADRTDVLHMKDMVIDEDRGFREIGEGDVDMATCFEAGRDAGVEWFVYEHDNPENPAASIEAGGSFLNDLI